MQLKAEWIFKDNAGIEITGRNGSAFREICLLAFCDDEISLESGGRGAKTGENSKSGISKTLLKSYCVLVSYTVFRNEIC